MKHTQAMIMLILFATMLTPTAFGLNEPPIPNVPTTTINEPPVINPPAITSPSSGITSAQLDMIVTQNATLMKKISELKAELSKYATKTQLAETRLDVFQAVEYNTQPTKTILPYATLTFGLFAFLLFIFGSVEASRVLQNRQAQGNLRCPNCGKYAKPLETSKGIVYPCQCNNVYAKINPKILDDLRGD